MADRTLPSRTVGIRALLFELALAVSLVIWIVTLIAWALS
jgi:hypothetical protein